MKTLEQLQKEVDIEMTLEELKKVADDKQVALYLAFKTEMHNTASLIVKEMNNMKTDISELKADVNILKTDIAEIKRILLNQNR